MLLRSVWCFFTRPGHITEAFQGKYSSLPPKIKDSYWRDEIRLELSKPVLHVHYCEPFPWHWVDAASQNHCPVIMRITVHDLRVICTMTSQTTEGDVTQSALLPVSQLALLYFSQASHLAWNNQGNLLTKIDISAGQGKNKTKQAERQLFPFS